MVAGSFKSLGFVVKIEMFPSDPAQLWGRQWADISSSQVFQDVCEF